jgi:hypothetical protein
VAASVLIYAGISVGVGLVCGMMNSTILRCLDKFDYQFGDRLLFVQKLSIK